ncbi:endophilin-B2 isoform X4 [Pleurodeles waltl]|uniref:endophilin-B2 isoform X4 n=1 Tax=Pleurodeles waltl TaxID=8319 RepID=UPI003709427C
MSRQRFAAQSVKGRGIPLFPCLRLDYSVSSDTNGSCNWFTERKQVFRICPSPRGLSPPGSGGWCRVSDGPGPRAGGRSLGAESGGPGGGAAERSGEEAGASGSGACHLLRSLSSHGLQRQEAGLGCGGLLLPRRAGMTLLKVGETEKRLGGAERDFIHSSSINFLTPLRNFLEGDWRTISKERRILENRRLDLDACKARLKKAKIAEAKAAALPDFQETRPRNYVLSASASALWSDEVDKAEHELRVAQTEFDRQAEVTRLLLEGISSTHVNHLRCLHEFVEAQATYYAQCYQYMVDLQKQLGSARGEIFPATLVVNSESVSSPLSTSPGTSSVPVASGPVVEGSLSPSDVRPPASGTRKARVLYDYEAADSSELSLKSDELITVYSLPGMDPDWLVGERGNQKGKVPVTYLELLS